MLPQFGAISITEYPLPLPVRYIMRWQKRGSDGTWEQGELTADSVDEAVAKFEDEIGLTRGDFERFQAELERKARGED